MPTSGQTLVGFLEQADAIAHLRTACVVRDHGDGALIKEWETARHRLGKPIERVGKPEILDIPPEGSQYIQTLNEQPWIRQSMENALKGCEYKYVEIRPLLAYQWTVDGERADHHNGHIDNVPTLVDMLPICLPIQPATEPLKVFNAPGSLMVTSRSLNFQAFAQGFVHQNFIGLQIGVSLPLAHVVRYNGRCYLHNGYHRTVGLGKMGAIHIPCVFRDVASPEEAGIKEAGTFQIELLESDNPPSLDHFISGRAYDVQLKAFKRTLHVSWAEYVTTEE